MMQNDIRSYELSCIANPLVSILIPVYSMNKIVINSIQSCLDQRYKTIEVICLCINLSKADIDQLEAMRKKDQRIKIFKSKSDYDLPKISSEIIRKSTGQYFISFGKGKCFYKNALQKILSNLDITTYLAAGITQYDQSSVFNMYFQKLIAKKNDRHPQKYFLTTLVDIDSFIVSRFYYDSINMPEKEKNIFDIGFYLFMLNQVGANNFRTATSLVNHYQNLYLANSKSNLSKIEFEINLINRQLEEQEKWLDIIMKHSFKMNKTNLGLVREMFLSQTLNDILYYWKYYNSNEQNLFKQRVWPVLENIINKFSINLKGLPVKNKKELIDFTNIMKGSL